MNTSIPTLDISLATPAERRNVLRLCLARRHQSPVELERQVSAFMDYARALSIDLNHLWICRNGHRDVSACACIRSPGRSAMLLLPSTHVHPADPRAIRAMLGRIHTSLFSNGVELIQGLVEEDDNLLRDALKGEAFEEIALLRYLERPLEGSSIDAPPPAELSPFKLHWHEYSTGRHDLFASSILRTYEASLDCPLLSRLRDIEDVIAGHKASGIFKPELWRLLMHGDEPAGCALLASHPLRPMVEVVYMGVLPNYRNHRVGRFILGTVLRAAQAQGFNAVTLAVDSANGPGRKLYSHFGFTETTTRRALILTPSHLMREQRLV